MQRGVLYTLISEKYGIGRSTVADIKNKTKLPAYKYKMTKMGNLIQPSYYVVNQLLPFANTVIYCVSCMYFDIRHANC